MKKVVIFIVFVVCSLSSYSQYERINWIFFIDGKIPFYTQFWGEFICFENTPKEKIIKFEYTIGDIKVSTDDLKYIRENADSIKLLTIKLYYREFTRKSRNFYIYSFKISPSDFRCSYMVFEITNLNKKKGFFRLGYEKDGISTLRCKNEPSVFIKTTWKMSDWATSDTVIMQQKKDCGKIPVNNANKKKKK